MPLDRVGEVDGGDTTLTPAAVDRRVLSVYRNGIMRCYREYLAAAPGAGGTLVVRFTVNAAGRAEDGRAEGFPSPLSTCVESLVRGWTFPIPRDEDGKAASAPFTVRLRLSPDA